MVIDNLVYNRTSADVERVKSLQSRIESGKYSVGFDTLQAIAEALGGTIDIIV